MSLYTEAEAYNLQAKIASDEKRKVTGENVIQQALNISASMAKSIVNSKANNAYIDLEEEFLKYQGSGKQFEDSEGNLITDSNQILENLDNWANEKIEAISPIYREQVRNSWNANILTKKASFLSSGIELLEKQKAENAQESYTRASITSYDINEDTLKRIVTNTSYKPNLWFDSKDTNMMNVLGEKGLKNQVGFQLLQYGNALKDLGYKDYEIANELKAKRYDLAKSNYVDEAVMSYYDAYKNGGNQSAVTLKIKDDLKKGVDYFGRALTDKEINEILAEAQKKVSTLQESYKTEQTEIYNTKVLPAIFSIEDDGGAVNREEFNNLANEYGFNINMMDSATRTTLYRHLDYNGMVDKVAETLDQYKNATSEEEKTKIVQNAEFSKKELDLWGTRFKIETNGDISLKGSEEFTKSTRRMLESTLLPSEQQSRLDTEKAQVEKQEISNVISEISNLTNDIEINFYKDGTVPTIEEYSKQLVDAGIPVDSKLYSSFVANGMAKVYSLQNSSNSKKETEINRFISNEYNKYLLDCLKSNEDATDEGFENRLKNNRDFDYEANKDAVTSYLVTLKNNALSVERKNISNAYIDYQLETDHPTDEGFVEYLNSKNINTTGHEDLVNSLRLDAKKQDISATSQEERDEYAKIDNLTNEFEILVSDGVKSMTREEYIKYLQDNGIDTEKNMAKVTSILVGIAKQENTTKATEERQNVVNQLYDDLEQWTMYYMSNENYDMEMYLRAQTVNDAFVKLANEYIELVDNQGYSEEYAMQTLSEKYETEATTMTEMSSIIGDRIFTTTREQAKDVFAIYGNDKAYGQNKTLNEYRKENENKYSEKMRIANSTFAIHSQYDEEYNYKVQQDENTIRYMILSGNIDNVTKMYEAMDCDKQRITEEAYNEFIELINKNPSATLNKYEINLPQIETDAFKTLGFDVSDGMRTAVRKGMMDYVMHNFNRIENGQINSEEIIKSVNENISSLICKSIFDTSKFDTFKDKNTIKKQSNNLKTEFNDYAKNSWNNNTTNQNTLGYILAVDITNNEKLRETIEAKDLFTNTKNKADDKDRVYMALSLALQSRGITLPYDHSLENSDKDKQQEQIMTMINTLPNTDAQMCISAAEELYAMAYAKRNVYNSISDMNSKLDVDIRAGKTYLVGVGEIKHETSFSDNSLKLTADDGKEYDVTNVSRRSLEEAIRKFPPSVDETILEYEGFYDDIKTYEFLHPGTKVEVNIVKNNVIGNYVDIKFVNK